ncbi:MAG: UDP-N-acetylglucosamine 2-epimerase (non-hydrolyzing) [Nitrospinota bacterium]|nr:UDP-N-acetylglucosamine 2-epimerase (non-hydrolyzing) [Nitrospinota bacterium]
MEAIKIISVVGTRPNFVKIAPLCEAMEKVNDRIEHILVHTGQHYDMSMSRDFFETLSIPKPDIHLEVGSGSHAVQTASIMTKFEKVCNDLNPDWVIVVGDVNSTLACSLVAKKIGLKVAHVEAGLRSFDMSMPEEINRKVTDSIADLFFTPSIDADENLKREGVDEKKIKRVGNIMIDTLVREIDKADKKNTLERFGMKTGKFAYATLHRPSNVDDRSALLSIFESLADISFKIPIVLPLHPRTKLRLEEYGLADFATEHERLILAAPLSYHESICLIKNAAYVITDSGGVQEETTYLGIPCLTLRPNTERPVTITIGTNKLTSIENLKTNAEKIMQNTSGKVTAKVPEMWDGKTAGRIVKVFLELP